MLKLVPGLLLLLLTTGLHCSVRCLDGSSGTGGYGQQCESGNVVLNVVNTTEQFVTLSSDLSYVCDADVASLDALALHRSSAIAAAPSIVAPGEELLVQGSNLLAGPYDCRLVTLQIGERKVNIHQITTTMIAVRVGRDEQGALSIEVFGARLLDVRTEAVAAECDGPVEPPHSDCNVRCQGQPRRDGLGGYSAPSHYALCERLRERVSGFRLPSMSSGAAEPAFPDAQRGQ